MLCNYTVSQKNVPPLVCYNWHTWTHFDIFFGRNVTDKVSNQKTLCWATPNNLCFCTTWQNRQTRKSHFSTKMLYQCIAGIQLVAPWFLQSFWLTTHTHATIWLPKSCKQCVQFGAVVGMVQSKGSQERRSTWTVLNAQCICTNALSSWRKKCHMWCVW